MLIVALHDLRDFDCDLVGKAAPQFYCMAITVVHMVGAGIISSNSWCCEETHSPSLLTNNAFKSSTLPPTVAMPASLKSPSRSSRRCFNPAISFLSSVAFNTLENNLADYNARQTPQPRSHIP